MSLPSRPGASNGPEIIKVGRSLGHTLWGFTCPVCSFKFHRTDAVIAERFMIEHLLTCTPPALPDTPSTSSTPDAPVADKP